MQANRNNTNRKELPVLARSSKDQSPLLDADLLLAKLIKQSQQQIDILLSMKNTNTKKEVKNKDEQKNLKERTFGGDFKDFFGGMFEQLGAYVGYITGANVSKSPSKTKPLANVKRRVEPSLSKEPTTSDPRFTPKQDNIQQVIATLAGENSLVKTTIDSLKIQKPEQKGDGSVRFLRRLATEVVLLRKFLESSDKLKSRAMPRKEIETQPKLILPGTPGFNASKTIENTQVKSEDDYIDKLSTAIAKKLEDVIGSLGRSIPGIDIDLPDRRRPRTSGSPTPDLPDKNKNQKSPQPMPDVPEADRKPSEVEKKTPLPQDEKDNKPKPQSSKGKVPSKLGSIFQIGLGLLGLAGTAATYSGELNTNEEEELAKLKQKAAEQKRLENVQEKVQVPSQSNTGIVLDEVSKEKTDLTNMSDMLEGMLKPIISNTVVDNSKSQFLTMAAETRNNYGPWMNNQLKNQIV